MTEHPTIVEELERKALEQIERLMRHLEQGKINANQYAAGMDTIFHVINGLVSESIILALNTVDTTVEYVESRSFWRKKDGHVVAYHRHDHGEKLRIVLYRPGQAPYVIPRVFKEATIPSQAAKQAMSMSIDTLLNQDGYQEI
jgi:hypothetical protein